MIAFSCVAPQPCSAIRALTLRSVACDLSRHSKGQNSILERQKLGCTRRFLSNNARTFRVSRPCDVVCSLKPRFVPEDENSREELYAGDRFLGRVGSGDPVYKGQFGDYVITDEDRRGVLAYRGSLVLAAASVAASAGLVCLSAPDQSSVTLTALYLTFCASLGISLATIHIYIEPLHQFLQALWAVGTISALTIGIADQSSTLVSNIYTHPILLLASGWTFVAMTGLFFKEAFCFARAEAFVLTLLVPVLVGGHFFRILPQSAETPLLVAVALMFSIFAGRKFTQLPEEDIGDKSVFDYIHQQQQQKQQQK